MRDRCDKCGGEIRNGFCSCGQWFEGPDDYPPFIKAVESVIFEYHKLCEPVEPDDVFTGDHHSGTSICLWQGNYYECLLVKQFIKNLKKK